MENLPMIIVASVGGLLVLLVILFIRSQKKQDIKEAENTQKILENLQIDIQDASVDIDDAVAEELASQTESGIETGPDTAGEIDSPVRFSEQPDTKAAGVTDPVKPAVDQAAEKPANDELELMDNQNELVIELESHDSASSDVVDIFVEKSGIAKVVAEPAPDVLEDESELSELDALFNASSDVEDMVLSGQKSSMFDADQPFDDADDAGDLLQIDFDKPVVTAAPEHTEPAPVVTPPVKDTSEPAERVLDPDDQIRHEKAKRIARVIVNDIRNYNPDNLAEGIRIGNIMKTLGKEVERGRLLYVKRVPADIAKETNYYREALVKILADGQADLLGL